MRYATAIITGKGRGKRIGYPTLNLIIPDALKAEHGIYAGRVFIGGKRYGAAIHFGPIPTFQEQIPTLEAFLLDTVLDEPPESIEFELTLFIREIKYFSDTRELSAQIARDVSDARRAFGD